MCAFSTPDFRTKVSTISFNDANIVPTIRRNELERTKLELKSGKEAHIMEVNTWK